MHYELKLKQMFQIDKTIKSNTFKIYLKTLQIFNLKYQTDIIKLPGVSLHEFHFLLTLLNFL